MTTTATSPRAEAETRAGAPPRPGARATARPRRREARP